MRGDMVTALAAPVALGSVVGAVLGEAHSHAGVERKVRVLFVVVLLALGIQVLLTACGVHFSGAEDPIIRHLQKSHLDFD